MVSKEYILPNENSNILKDDGAFDQLSTTRLKQAILLSDTEKFRRFTKMMRIGLMLKNAKKYPLNP
ncbi:MAG TPA: hypothetical protein PLY34_13755 [Ferruginibacter sp.]|nr:hypothetical protein [Ferruginibacter sp.]HPH93117.1 hypothetical protein [Ferruginibacter sp.]